MPELNFSAQSKNSRTPSLEHYFETQFNRKPIKLACFDIDGTLLGLDGNYTSVLRDSIRRIQSMGVKTCIASGRPYFATQFLWRELGLIDAGVYCTGAQIFEPKTQKKVAGYYLNDETVSRLLATLRASGVYYELYTDEGFFVEEQATLSLGAEDILTVHSEHLRASPSVCSLDKVEQPVVKLLIGADTSIDADTLANIEAQFPECIFAYASLPAYPNWLFASIVSINACKKMAFSTLIRHHGVAANEVISFGDAQSDEIFLSLAGIGVAMGNAKPGTQAVADLVAPPVWEDGVAQVLDKLVTQEVKCSA